VRESNLQLSIADSLQLVKYGKIRPPEKFKKMGGIAMTSKLREW